MGHANARLTPVTRRELVARIVVHGWSVTAAAEAAQVSRKCAYKWLARWESGDRELVDGSSRPRSHPQRTPVRVEVAVVAARRLFRKGPEWISAQLGVPARTVSRILRRHQMPYLWELDLVTGAEVRTSKRTQNRYEKSSPGELVHMDTKKIAVIPEGGGSIQLGRPGYRTETRKKAKPGYEYVHSVIDDHSRFAYSEVLASKNAAACAGFFERAIRVFADHGISIEAVMTDNAWEYIHSNQFADLCDQIGARHITIRPYSPWQNGKVERFNRTLQTEWAYRQVFESNDDRAAALPDFLHRYNHHRRHHALGGQPPISRLSPT